MKFDDEKEVGNSELWRGNETKVLHCLHDTYDFNEVESEVETCSP